MENIEELKKKIKELEQKNAYLEDKINFYERPSANRAFYVGQKVLNQQVDYLDKFDFAKEISSNPKEDKIFDRAMETYEKLPIYSSRINALALELKLTKNEEEDTTKKLFIETIADSRK
jgi:exonuclease VII small subunit